MKSWDEQEEELDKLTNSMVKERFEEVENTMKDLDDFRAFLDLWVGEIEKHFGKCEVKIQIERERIMGILGDASAAITNNIDAGTGGWWSDSSTKASAKRNLRYNQWLQAGNQAFQKYMAQNAHQMEVQDLIDAGLNPALSATGSSAGSIAGSSSAQGTSPGQAVNNLGNIVDSINSLRKTNAEIDKLNAETGALKRGGFHQWWLGGKNPSITNAIDNRANEAIQEKNKNYNKNEKEIADKFDNFWGPK